MNPTTSPQPAAEPGWPPADTPVLASRPLRPGADRNAVRFGDEVWPLTAAHADAHTATRNIIWSWFPDPFVLPLKTFALAALTHPFAEDPSVFATSPAGHRRSPPSWAG